MKSAGPNCLKVVDIVIGGTTAIEAHCSGSCPAWQALVAKDLSFWRNPFIIFGTESPNFLLSWIIFGLFWFFDWIYKPMYDIRYVCLHSWKKDWCLWTYLMPYISWKIQWKTKQKLFKATTSLSGKVSIKYRSFMDCPFWQISLCVKLIHCTVLHNKTLDLF